ncbi:MAG: Fe-S protein assembly co-chaperone HscB [Deltaproteobacteria bacterium]|nr:MAG: Fe-S protein assembly co-chaperone HscB [Deltaproteobacteria bacterium]
MIDAVTDADRNATVTFTMDVRLDPFATLGLPRSVDLDRAAVDEAYYAASRAVHPDRFAGADEATRRRAEVDAARLNEAYRMLKDRVGRLEALCRLGGIDLDVTGGDRGAPMPDQAFLLDMIERREAIEAASREGEDALEDLRDGVEAEIAETLGAAEDALRQGDVRRAAEALVRRRYLARLLDEIDEALTA